MTVKIDLSRDALFDELGLIRLRESYMRPDEKSPQERLAFVAEQFASNDAHAQRIYDYASRHWLSFSTPILSFGRSKNGLPVSCYLTYMADSADGLVETLSEVNRLSMAGGGVGIHVGIRNADEKSVGVMPHLKVYDAACLAYRQGSTRRGSYAAFLDADHPDIIPFVEMRKPTGDQNLKALNLHHGVNLTDAFMEKIEASMRDENADDSWDLKNPATGEVVETISARDLWQRILEMRMHTGEPYLVFLDTANRTSARKSSSRRRRPARRSAAYRRSISNTSTTGRTTPTSSPTRWNFWTTSCSTSSITRPSISRRPATLPSANDPSGSEPWASMPTCRKRAFRSNRPSRSP